jgi:hypothetical protein
MSERSIETKWDDNEVILLLPKVVRFRDPLVMSSNQHPHNIRPKEYAKCFFTKKELKILNDDRSNRIYEEQFETTQRGKMVEITFPVRKRGT